MTGIIGWFAAAVLLATIARQVYSQRRGGSLSRWLFIGQITASSAFVIYSCLLGNWVLVVTNVLILGTAVAGGWVPPANRRKSAAFSGASR